MHESLIRCLIRELRLRLAFKICHIWSGPGPITVHRANQEVFSLRLLVANILATFHVLGAGPERCGGTVLALSIFHVATRARRRKKYTRAATF